MSLIDSQVSLIEGASLGIYTNSSTPLSNPFYDLMSLAKTKLQYADNAVSVRLERFALQSVARSILPKSRTAGCLRNRISGTAGVAIKYSAIRKKASYGNLQTCASVWCCSICASRISEHRRKDLVKLVSSHKAAGGIVLLVTRTFPHTSKDDLSCLLAKLSKAEAKFKAGAPYERLVSRFKVVGTVRSVECTYGANGWHPHIHELYFLENEVNFDDFKLSLYARWRSAAVRGGFPSPDFQHGIDVRDGSYAAQYASKWGIESELTKWHVKRSKKSLSLSPFDFLRIALHEKDSKSINVARLLFQEYALAFKGKRQLVYSKGLRTLYDLEDELSEEEAAVGSDIDEEIVGMLELMQWKAICKSNLRGEVLEAVNASDGEFEAIAEVMALAWQRFEALEAELKLKKLK